MKDELNNLYSENSTLRSQVNSNTGSNTERNAEQNIELEVYLWKQALLEIALYQGGNQPAMEDLILGYLGINAK